jgi:hypothetical protein
VQRFVPALVLALIATLVPEVLFGSTPLTEPGRIVATMPIYAGGAVVIRELARRRRAGWLTIALLGVAYGIVEEGLALGSFFNPSMFNAGLVGGRLVGVNWTWTEWTLGYHPVWSISIPILLTELLFPARRSDVWLGRVGLAIAGVVYLAGATFLLLITRYAIAPDFTPPTVSYVGAALVAIGLVGLALGRPARPVGADKVPSRPGDAPSPWLVGLLALVVALAWFGLLLLPAPIKLSGWVIVPMVLDLALLLTAVSLVRRWSAPGHGWTDLHRLALAAGPMPASMLWGFVYVTAGRPLDRALQAAACMAVTVLLARFAQSLHRSGGSALVAPDRSAIGRPVATRPGH